MSITNPIKNGNLGAINENGLAATIQVSGPNGKLTISGN